MKCHFVANDRFCKTDNLVPVPREVIWRNGMTVPRCRFCEEIKEDLCSVPADAFSNQSKRMLDQLRGIEVNKPFLT